MENKNMFYRGYVELLVLNLLLQRDYYGYELVKKLKEISNDKISLSVGTLYPTLYKLIDQKFITDYKKQTGERMVKVYYHLEEQGKNRLKVLIEEYREFSEIMNNILDIDYE